MRLLLDTHTFLWMLDDTSRLSVTARQTLEAGENQLVLGIGSCWEMAIKNAAGKLELPGLFLQFIETQLRENRVHLLPVTLDHLGRLNTLGTHPQGHRDPFDRLLVAQALHEGMPLVSADAALDAYGVVRVW